MELGSHLTARQTIIAQADLQVEQSIRDYETWERDIVDLKAKDKVVGDEAGHNEKQDRAPK